MKKTLALLLAILTLASVFTFGTSADSVIEPGVEPFDDVAQSAWYHEGAIFCKINGYMNGTADYTFAPNMELTRAQMAVIFSVIAGVDTSEYAETATPFTDVEKGVWYERAVSWMYANKITGGISDTLYGPNVLVTREQLCVFVMKLSEYLGKSTEDKDVLEPYSDKDTISSWAVEGVKYAVKIKVISGFPDGTIGPKGNVTRAQMSVITKAYVLNTIKGDHEHDWADATCADPAVCKECGIRNGLPLGHNLDDPCAGGECKRCHETVAAKEHTFKVASTVNPTCTEAGKTVKECRRCGKTEETAIAALGHTTDNGICSRCGAEIFNSKFDKLYYYIGAKGQNLSSDSSRWKGVVEEIDYEDGDYSLVRVYIDKDMHSICCDELYYWGDGDSEQTGFEMYSDGTTCVYNTYDDAESGERVEIDTGKYFNKMTYKLGDTIWFVNSNNPSRTGEFQARVTEYFPILLNNMDLMISSYFSMSLEELGFSCFIY